MTRVRPDIDEGEWVNAAGVRVAFLHQPDNCEGQPCVAHNPTPHSMSDWPMNLRETALIERLCSHGVGHPDPDSVWFFDSKGFFGFDVHGCCGCCHARAEA